MACRPPAPVSLNAPRALLAILVAIAAACTPTVRRSATRAVEYALDGSVAREMTAAGGVLAGITLQPGEVKFLELSR